MTTEAQIEDGTTAPTGKPKFDRRLLIGGVAGIALIAAAAGSYFMFFTGKPAHEPVEVVAHPESFIFNLPTMTVNLKSTGDSEEFMKLTVAIEVANEATMQQIQPRMAKVVDAFQVYLRELRKSDLEGSAGIYRLKEELRRRVNVAVYPAQVDSILFKEILVQ